MEIGELQASAVPGWRSGGAPAVPTHAPPASRGGAVPGLYRDPAPAAIAATDIAGSAFVTASDLDEAGERRWLAAAGKDVVVLPYGPLDPSRPPVLLVHGFGQAPETMRDLATRFSRLGRQVLVAFYADTRRTTHESGLRLARELADLRGRVYSAGMPLDVVAHSMGGLVVRCALNYLEDPAWLGGGDAVAAAPRAGFGPLRVRAIDSPWEGFVPSMPGWVYRLLAWLLDVLGFGGVVDMVAQSRMYERLYRPRLEGVGIESLAVHKPGHDMLRTLPELEPGELRAIVRFIETGAAPPTARGRNMAGSLRQDDRYEALAAALARRRREHPDTDGGAAALVAAFAEVMPAVDGDHTGVLRDDPADEHDLVDRIVLELGGAMGGASGAPRRAERRSRAARLTGAALLDARASLLRALPAPRESARAPGARRSCRRS